MKIRQELSNDNPKVKIGYYDLGCMHKESTKKKNKKKFISISFDMYCPMLR